MEQSIEVEGRRDCDVPLPTMSVIIPTFNRAANLARAVEPLLKDAALTELIVVLDGCSDGSAELLGRLADRDPRLKPVEVENRGKQRALEVGLSVAHGDVVLFLDDDLVADPALVTGHARHHTGRSNSMVVGYTPTVLPTRWTPGDSTTWLWDLEYEKECADWERHPDAILENLWGCNFSMRRHDCERIGLASSEFRDLYFQDQDFGLRCRRSGMGALFDRSLLAQHRHRRSIDGFLHDAYSQGAGQWVIHHLHADMMGPFDPRVFERWLPGPARLVIRASRFAGLRRAMLWLLREGASLAGRARWAAAEMLFLRLGRRVQQRAGALAAAIEATGDGSGLDKLRRGGHIEVSGVRDLSDG